MNDDVLKLSNQLCFPLYASAKEVVRRYKPFLDEIGLTYTQYIAMMVLWEQKCVTVKALGECLYLDSGTLTPLLKKLEAKALILRERSASDERQVHITLTEQGEALKAQAVGIPAKMGRCLQMPAEDVQTLYTLLYRLLGAMEASPCPEEA
mgnify:CR=1 FL=1